MRSVQPHEKSGKTDRENRWKEYSTILPIFLYSLCLTWGTVVRERRGRGGEERERGRGGEGE